MSEHEHVTVSNEVIACDESPETAHLLFRSRGVSRWQIRDCRENTTSVHYPDIDGKPDPRGDHCEMAAAWLKERERIAELEALLAEYHMHASSSHKPVDCESYVRQCLAALEDGAYEQFIEERLDASGGDLRVVCQGCNGMGTRAYANTTTWHGGIGGQAITGDVCDKCWGSGNRERPWPSHRNQEAHLAEGN